MGTGNMISALASYNGKLYTGDNNGECYRYDGDNNWVYCGGVLRIIDEPLQDRIDSMMVYQGHLYAGNSGGNGYFYRYEGGTTWTCVRRNPFDISQLHTMQTYENDLFLGTWPTGKVLRYDGKQIHDTGQVGISTEKHQINETNDLVVYNGKLYAGVIPKAELWRYDGDWNWTLLRRLVNNPDWKAEELSSWCRIPCFNIFNGKLYMGTSTCEGIAEANPHFETGRVIELEVGKCISYDDDLGSGWKHITITRESNSLNMYIDGELVTTSTPFEGQGFDITNERPLIIGSGPQSSFTGMIDDVRIYDGALDADQIKTIFKEIKSE